MIPGFVLINSVLIFQLTFQGPLLDPKQILTSVGSCQTTCAPSNTNDLQVTICCLAQNNCNNVFAFGPHHRGGQSGERGVNRTRTGTYPQIKGVPKKTTTTIKPKTTTVKPKIGRRFSIDLE